MSSHGGLNFYIGNNPQADGTYSGVPGITPNIAGQQDDAKRVAEHAEGRPLADGDVSAHFYARGSRGSARNRPQPRGSFCASSTTHSAASHLSVELQLPVFRLRRALVAALPGRRSLVLIPVGLDRTDRRSPRRPEIRLLDLGVLHSAVRAVSRPLLRLGTLPLPLLVPLSIGAGAAVDRVFGMVRRSEWRHALAWLGAAAVLVIVVNWPLGLDDGRAEARVRTAERLVQHARYHEAEQWTERALKGHPLPATVHFRVGRAFLAGRRLDAALEHLQQAATLDPSRSEISYALGQALLDAGRPAEAVPHLRRALSAGIRPDRRDSISPDRWPQPATEPAH